MPSTTGTTLVLDSGNVIATLFSTRKVKQNIKPIDSDYSAKIYDLKPAAFNYIRDPDIQSYGFIAEEVHDVMPELVVYKDGEPAAIRYAEFDALIIQEMQKLLKRVEALEFLLEINNIKGH